MDSSSPVHPRLLIAQGQTESIPLLTSTSVPGRLEGGRGTKNNIISFSGLGEGGAQVPSIPV